MLITLTGYMGCGKSTVGSLVANALGCPFLDLDVLIEKKTGKTIPQIFEADGEAAFRLMEKKILEETVKKYAESTAILALGGGTITVPAAVGLLREKTLCIWLRATLETLQCRIEGQTEGRPLADESFAERLEQRIPLYEQAAQIILDTDGCSPEEIADEIIISCL